MALRCFLSCLCMFMKEQTTCSKLMNFMGIIIMDCENHKVIQGDRSPNNHQPIDRFLTAVLWHKLGCKRDARKKMMKLSHPRQQHPQNGNIMKYHCTGALTDNRIGILVNNHMASYDCNLRHYAKHTVSKKSSF